MCRARKLRRVEKWARCGGFYLRVYENIGHLCSRAKGGESWNDAAILPVEVFEK